MSALVAGGADAAATLPNGADAVMLAAGMGSSRNASRRGIETIDFGKVEPESRVREAVAAAGGPARRRAPPRVRPATPRCTSPRRSATTPSCNSWSSTAPSLTAKNRRGFTPLVAAMFGSTVGRGRSAAPAGADSLGFEPPVELAHPTTVALLKKLGATE